MHNILVFPFILCSILLNTLAQIALKVGMSTVGNLPIRLTWPSLQALLAKLMLNPYILGGLLCYGLSLASWLIVLARADVSYAYPMTSLGYVLTALLGYYFLQEALSSGRLLGIFFIILGVVMMSRS